MTKVLLTTDTVGGVWNYTLELIRAIQPWGVEFAVATMGGPLSDDQRAALGRLENVQLYESGYKLIWMHDPWRDIQAAGRWLLQLARRIKPDVVHLNDYAHGSLPWDAPRLLVGHSCVLSWWEAVRGTPVPDSYRRYRQVVTRGLQAADLVVVPTQTMLDTLERLYGPLGHSQVILNGRDRRAFHAARKRPWILSAGRVWDEAKNVAALAEAAPRLHWPVLVAGSAKHPDGGEATFAGVQFLGRLAAGALAAWYARAAIYALPARYEPFGLTPLEAALSGCALVLSDIPTLREIWSGAACFVAPEDPETLVRGVNRLIAQPRQRTACAARCQSRAGQLSAHRMAAAYHKAYQGLLRCPASVAPASRVPEGTCCDSLPMHPPMS